jgi:hypothetical protein
MEIFGWHQSTMHIFQEVIAMQSILRIEELSMLTRNCNFKLHYLYAIRFALVLMILSLGSSSFYTTTNAQQTSPNDPGFTLGFFSIDSSDARACSTANSTLKIEGEALEPGDSTPRNIKLEVTFKNGVMSTKDKDGVLRSVLGNPVYGNFYYLTSHLRGHLTVSLKLKKAKDAEGKTNQENDEETLANSNDRKKNRYLVDLNLDEFKPIPEKLPTNEAPNNRVNDIPEYVDFAIPCN